jgi:hypothetical protein
MTKVMNISKNSQQEPRNEKFRAEFGLLAQMARE